MKTCSVDECARPLYAKLLCKQHYENARRQLTDVDPCIVRGCFRMRYGSGPVCQLHYQRCRAYALGPLQLAVLLDRGCAICGAAGNASGRDLHIDHDHRCCPKAGGSCGNCIRGVLCHGCNIGLGALGDDIERLIKAVDYLRE